MLQGRADAEQMLRLLGIGTDGHMLFFRRLHARHAKGFGILDARIKLGDEFTTTPDMFDASSD